MTQIDIDPDLRGLTRAYFEMHDESFIAMGERLAREIGGNFRVIAVTIYARLDDWKRGRR